MRHFGYLVVEGPHDIEFCYRLLSHASHAQLKRVQKLADLDPFFRRIVPRQFPHEDDLHKRMPVPLFLQSDQITIAIHSAIGETNLVSTLNDALQTLSLESFHGVGVMMDSDSTTPPAQRYESIRQSVKKKTGMELPPTAGQVAATGPVRLGAFVLPDNTSPGTLEDLLLDSAATQYAKLLPLAEQYVQAAETSAELKSDHLTDFRKPSGRQKAVVGAMSSIFRPGKAVQASIQDNDWVRGAALKLPRIREVQRFLTELFDLPLPTT